MACLFFCLAQSSQIKMKQEQNWRIEAQRRAAKSQVCYGTSQPLVESMITISDMKSSFWRVNTTVWLLMQWKCRAADEIYRFNAIGKTLIVLSHAMRNGLMFDSFNPTQQRQHSNTRTDHFHRIIIINIIILIHIAWACHLHENISLIRIAISASAHINTWQFQMDGIKL